jgi:glycerol kinase
MVAAGSAPLAAAMTGPLLLGIDEGTTAVKVALFDAELRPLAEAQRRVGTSHPAPGLVEQDPLEVLEAVVEAVAEVLETVPAQAEMFVGLAHQGESVLAWDALDGTPLTPVVVWQDKRQEGLLAELQEADVACTGLPIDPYFSAGKLAWLLRHDSGVRAAAAAGRLRLGTVDSFLTDRLGGPFATDLSTASRTQLLALGGEDWDGRLLVLFGLRREWLPATGPTVGGLGTLRDQRWERELPLRAQLVDQQAALAGAGCVLPGQVKATYGTGVFVLARTQAATRADGLLPTVAWALPDMAGAVGEVAYALDGGVFTAGALLEWLAGDLGLAGDVPALAQMAAQVRDSAGVRVLPALAGLGSPWWRPSARGVIAGLHAGVRPAHLARAALEAIAHRVADVVEAMGEGASGQALRVDGGLTNDPTLLQIQADVLGGPLAVTRADTTVLGAAMLAGLGAGVFASLAEAARRLPAGRTVTPSGEERERLRSRERWRSFVARAAALEDGG